ncbi:Transporter [Sulfidibacter corallicola]|uniref:Transporter n=1 Tax=Sulfidibacter corallicola TaxID=2818388 RepID=A0A8A4U0E8_SULCO|nr:transporter [Sulfidibacter corallicola]QTD52225.1 transporter [Sulfidibacter corallicola]
MLVLMSLLLFQTPELVTDRPDQSESAEVVPVGSWQFEMGVARSESDPGIEFETTAFPQTLIRYGLNPNLELRIGWDGVIDVETDAFGGNSDSGAGDTSLGVKWKLFDERGRRPQMAIVAGTNLTTAEDGFGSDEFEPAVRLAFSSTLSDRLGLGYNLGWSSLRTDDGIDEHTLATVQYSMVLGIGVSDRVGAFIEAFGDVPASAPGGPSNSIDTGITVALSPLVQVDAAGGFGISDEADDWFATVGISFRLDR